MRLNQGIAGPQARQLNSNEINEQKARAMEFAPCRKITKSHRDHIQDVSKHETLRSFIWPNRFLTFFARTLTSPRPGHTAKSTWIGSNPLLNRVNWATASLGARRNNCARAIRPVDARKSPKGFTLLEVLITSAIALTVMLAVAAGLVYNQKAQELSRQRLTAQRAAAELLEEGRRHTFGNLTPIIDRSVLIDDRRTAPANPVNSSDPALADDIYGLASLRLYRQSDGTELLTSAYAENFIMAQAQVRWTFAGRERIVTLATHFAP